MLYGRSVSPAPELCARSGVTRSILRSPSPSATLAILLLPTFTKPARNHLWLVSHTTSTCSEIYSRATVVHSETTRADSTLCQVENTVASCPLSSVLHVGPWIFYFSVEIGTADGVDSLGTTKTISCLETKVCSCEGQ